MNLESALLAVLATLVAGMIWVVKALMIRSDRILESRDTQIARAMDELAKAIASFQRVEEKEDAVHDALLKRMENLGSEHNGIIARIEALAITQKQLMQLIESVLASITQEPKP